MSEFIPGLTTQKGYTKTRKPQYKLYRFIGEHFDGNVSAAARHIKMDPFQLIGVVNFGVYASKSANRILDGMRDIDPSITFDSLFIRPTFRKVEKKKPVEYPRPIPPRVGSVHQLGTGIFARILERNR